MIDRRTPFAGGHEFGATGAYEWVQARVRLRVDPDEPENQRIVDLDKAPRDAEGLVECVSDLHILKPADMQRGNRRLFFEFANRGIKHALQFFNDSPQVNDPATIEHAGNGFLMRYGYTVAWTAWQGDVLPGEGRLLFKVPVAMDNGHTITGRVRSELVPDEQGIYCLPLSGDTATRSYPAVSLDPAHATLTRRQYTYSPRQPLPAGSWQFARLDRGQNRRWATPPSDSHLYIPGGFETGWIYELTYLAKDPLVLGLGYLAVREIVSFLMHDNVDSAGRPNPLLAGTETLERGYCWGRSQSGRIIREFVHSGFNRDEAGRRVFDGVFSDMAGSGRFWLNHRFAQPTRLPGQQHEDHFYYGDTFPFSYARSTDHLTGRTDAILSRPEFDPLVVHTHSSSEYWQRRGSLVHTDTRGDDLPQPPTVRVYAWTSVQHLPDPLFRTQGWDILHYPMNPVAISPVLRALLVGLDRWATDGRPLPASRVPQRADRTLVPFADWREQFPKIPGLVRPQAPNWFPLYDYGPLAARGRITIDPPLPAGSGKEYTVLVPAVDDDGNEIGGLRMPAVQVPLATYNGWNIRKPGFSPGVMGFLVGSCIPFPRTKEEREATGDPRRSIEERYATPDDFVKAFTAAVRSMRDDGFLLDEDCDRMVEAAHRVSTDLLNRALDWRGV
jgi:hypothetical protein